MRALVLLVALLLAGCVDVPADPDGGPEGAEVTFDSVTIETRLGSFTAILFCEETPLTCDFFNGLVDQGYYDGRAFGRIIPGFVIQEVDRTGGTTDQAETVDAEFETAVMFSAGAFGIARNEDPNSGSSEFFVMDFAISSLYRNYTAYAQVVDGLDVVHAIARVPAARTGPASAVGVPGAPVSVGVHDRVPVDPVVMDSVTLGTVTLSASEAAKYPLQVGETYATPQMRATLEWPADLAAGRASTLAWYVAPRSPPIACENTPTGPTCAGTGSAQDPEPVDLSGATIRFDGAGTGTIPFTEDPTAPGALAFEWTPPVAGSYQFHLEQGGSELVLANLTVLR